MTKGEKIPTDPYTGSVFLLLHNGQLQEYLKKIIMKCNQLLSGQALENLTVI